MNVIPFPARKLLGQGETTGEHFREIRTTVESPNRIVEDSRWITAVGRSLLTTARQLDPLELGAVVDGMIRLLSDEHNIAHP